MSIIGIDLGSYYFLVSKYKTNATVEVLSNKLDKRLSPTFFAFAKNKRYPNGKTLAAKDLNNAVVNGKDFFAMVYDVEKFKKLQLDYYPYKLLKDKNNQPYFEADYIKDKMKFGYRDIYYTYFNSIEDIVIYKKSEDENISDQSWIVSYPPYYTKEQKQELKMLCNFKYENNTITCKDILNEKIAYALCYGYENDSRYSDKSEILFLVDIGYTCASITGVKYENNKCTILGNVYSLDICGRNTDKLLVKYAKLEIQKSKEFKKDFEKIKNDNRCGMKILQSMISVKEKLSAEGASTINLTVSDLYDAEDFESTFSKEIFESLLKKGEYDKKIELLLDECVKKCKIKVDEVSGIVIAGGTCRIPFIQNILQIYLNDKMKKNCGLNKSINMDEHISYGCSYYGLILNGLWNYEVIDEDENELLLSNYSENTKKTIIEMNNHLSQFLCGYSDLTIDNKERKLLNEYFKGEMELITSTICIDSIEQSIDGIDYDTHLQEADKARNDMESAIYDLQHDLELIQDKKFVEKENEELNKVIEQLHNDKGLRILHAVKEFQNDFYKKWEEKKESRLHLAMQLCELSITVYPKERSEYESKLNELKSLDIKKDPMSKYINTCNNMISKKKKILEDLKTLATEYIKVISSSNVLKDVFDTLNPKLTELVKIISTENLKTIYTKRNVIEGIFTKYNTSIIKDLNIRLNKCSSLGNDVVDISALVKDIETLKSYINGEKLEKSPNGLKYVFDEYKKINSDYIKMKKDIINNIREFKQSILDEIKHIDQPIPKEIEELKTTIEKVEIAENIDLPECKNRITQLNNPYAIVVKKYESELNEKKNMLKNELDVCVIKDIKDSYLGILTTLTCESSLLPICNGIKILNETKCNYLNEMKSKMNELIKDIKENVKEIEESDKQVLDEGDIEDKDINNRIIVLFEVTNKYKNKYIERIKELNKKLNEVDNKDQQLTELLNKSKENLEKINKTNLYGVVIECNKLNDEIERVKKMNDSIIKSYLVKYQVLYDRIKDNKKSFKIPISQFIMMFEVLNSNLSNLRVDVYCNIVEPEYIKVIENMKKKIKEKNSNFDLSNKKDEEIVTLYLNPPHPPSQPEQNKAPTNDSTSVNTEQPPPPSTQLDDKDTKKLPSAQQSPNNANLLVDVNDTTKPTSPEQTEGNTSNTTPSTDSTPNNKPTDEKTEKNVDTVNNQNN